MDEPKVLQSIIDSIEESGSYWAGTIAGAVFLKRFAPSNDLYLPVFDTPEDLASAMTNWAAADEEVRRLCAICCEGYLLPPIGIKSLLVLQPKTITGEVLTLERIAGAVLCDQNGALVKTIMLREGP